jgi:hypothetical protein
LGANLADNETLQGTLMEDNITLDCLLCSTFYRPGSIHLY